MTKPGRRKNRISGQFSARTIEMLESPAYRALSLHARRILDRLEIEHGHHGGNDNGRLPCTYDHFQEYGVTRRAIKPALRELEVLGFIEITERGRAGNAEWRRPNYFRLTYRYVGNAGPTDEWKHIVSKEAAEMAAENAWNGARKNKTPVSFSASSRYPRRHQEKQIHSSHVATTSHSSDVDTTSIFSGSPQLTLCWRTPTVTEVLDPVERRNILDFWHPKILGGNFSSRKNGLPYRQA